jgi:hypothetical protein
MFVNHQIPGQTTILNYQVLGQGMLPLRQIPGQATFFPQPLSGQALLLSHQVLRHMMRLP